MRDIVIKFLQNNHFNQLDTDFDFYTNSQYSEYFIVSEYSPNELHNFFDDDKTSQVIKEFERLSVKSEHENIKKNTSLFILVEVDNLKEALYLHNDDARREKLKKWDDKFLSTALTKYFVKAVLKFS